MNPTASYPDVPQIALEDMTALQLIHELEKLQTQDTDGVTVRMCLSKPIEHPLRTVVVFDNGPDNEQRDFDHRYIAWNVPNEELE